MQNKIKKAMILSAGLGTRLTVITEKIPKPLVPILNLPNILHSLSLLKRAGITEVICNLFHLSDQIETYFKLHPVSDMKLSFIKETVLLGTGGGVKNASAFFENEPFVLLNCDFITNIDLGTHIAKHYAQNALATMVLFEDSERQSRYSKVGIDKNGALCSFPKIKTADPVRSGIFTGIHILESKCLTYLENKPSGINEVLYPALMKEAPNKTLGSFASHSYWLDTGDLPSLIHASHVLLDNLPKNLDVQELEPGIWASPKTILTKNLKLIPPVLIGDHCLLGSNSKIGPYVTVGDHSVLGEEVEIKNSILLSQSTVTKKICLDSVVVFEKNILPATPLT